MALPSAVTLGSLAFVVATGVGYVAVAAASGSPDAHAATPAVHHHAAAPTSTVPSKPVSVPVHSSPSHRPKPPAVPDVLVVLFNNTGVTGRAEAAAADLRDAGWSVTATDSWYGKIPEDTVYYPPDLHAAAVKLAKVLHIGRLHLAVAPMEFDRLTVIMASS